MTILTFVAVAVLVWMGTGAVRAYALRRSLLDIPNHRSSHTVPTPRGGGLSIVIVVLVATGIGFLSKVIEGNFSAAVLAGGGLIAWVGWIDDHQGLPAAWRAVAHFAAAVIAVWLIGTPDAITIGTYSLHVGWLYRVLAVLGLVWLTNLFNFMDGIDGIAAGEAFTVTAAGAGLLFASGQPGMGAFALILCGAALGFLVWNWPPAKIFMGDVGSGFLGFALGVLALASLANGKVQLDVWLLLLSVFLFDATVTLLRRLGRERIYEAHRRHAYQRAVQSGMSHRQVTTFVLILNLILIFTGVVAWLRPARAVPMLLLAVVLLGVVYIVVERRSPMWGEQSVPHVNRI